LDVTVQHSLAVGIIERLRQTGADQTHGLAKVGVVQQLTVAQGGRVKNSRQRAQAIQRMQDGLAVELVAWLRLQVLNDPLQRGAGGDSVRWSTRSCSGLSAS